jgi:putative spermidine/putrescine transport system ATP-binding protein
MPAADTTGAAVTLADVARHYAGVAAVDGVSLAIRAGEFLTLLGSSGSGKTTTLMMIAGFIEPDRGRIEIDGRDVTRLPPSRRDLGVVFQNYSLFPHMTVAQNVAFPLEMRGVPRAERESRVRAMLDLVRLEQRRDAYPRELSGGQQQRVALARALVFRPRALLMDEPLGALDKKLREHMQAEVKRLQGELGATVIYVTHDQEEALTMSDRVAVMQGGRVAQLGTPADLYERPATRWVAEFVGQSNFLAGTGVPGGVRLATGAIVPCATPVAAGRPALLVIRPEKLRLGASGGFGLDGTVSSAIYVGHATRFAVTLADGTALQVEEQNRAGNGGFRPGAPVSLSWDAADAWPLPAGAP